MYIIKESQKFFCKHCGNTSKLPKINSEHIAFKVLCHNCNKETFVTIKKKEKKSIFKNLKKIKRENFFSLTKFSFLTFFLTLILVSSFYLFDNLEIKMVDFDKKIAILTNNRPIRVYDKYNLLISEIYTKKTSELTLQEYPQKLKDFIINIEDQSFYTHYGFDITAIIRSFVVNIMSNEYRQGGSTITQQLARMILNKREKTILRKWEELKIAILLEWKLPKQTILLHYLNNVYLGHGAFGFDIGAKFYFNKKISQLNIQESIILISLISAPNSSSPLKNPERSIKKVTKTVNYLLQKGLVSSKEVKGILNLYKQFKFRSPIENVYGMRLEKSPYITEHVRNVLPRILPDINDIYKQGGYSIKTTISLPLQLKVGKITNLYLNKIQRQKLIKSLRYTKPKYNWEEFLEPFTLQKAQNYKKKLETAVIALNNEDGAIAFMQGGTKFSLQNQFNRTYQMYRQTGSTIKPIIYSSAIDRRLISPNSIFLDSPMTYKVKLGYWLPKNITNYYQGKITIQEAFRKSKNTVAVQVTEKLGKRNLENYFAKFFFPDSNIRKNRFRNDLSISLGSLELSPLEMSLAFSAFTNGGIIKRPYLIEEIKNNDNEIVYSYHKDKKDEFALKIPYKRRAISWKTSRTMIKMMKLSAKYSLDKYGYDSRISGKTGTTNDNKDVWFVGTTPKISMAIWIGYDDLKSMGEKAIAAKVAAPIWLQLFKAVDREKSTSRSKF